MIPRLKAALLFSSAIIVILISTACSEIYVSEDNNPTAAWEQFCGCISDGDYRAAIEMTGNSIEVSSSSLDDSIEGLMLTKLFENVKAHAVTEPVIKGTSAWQTVSITHIDIDLLMNKVLSGIMDETADYEWVNGSYKTDESISEAVKASLSNQLSGDISDCLVTDIIKVEFRYKDGRWSPVMSRSLYDAITGNAAYGPESVKRFFEKYDSQKAAASGSAAG